MARNRHSNRRRPRRRSRDQGGAIKWAALAGTVLAVLGGGGFAMSEMMKIERPDGYCYVRADQFKAAIFVDSSFTQTVSATQMSDFRMGFEQAWDQAPANAKVMIFTTAQSGRGSLVRPVLEMCKPAANPAEQAQIGAPDKPAAYLDKHAQMARAEYLTAVDAVLRESQDPDAVAGDSPILEQIQSVSRYPDFAGERRSLTLITDGINNSEAGKFCIVKGAMPSFARYAQSAAYRHVKPRSFAGTDVHFMMVEHGPMPSRSLPFCTSNEIRTWWPDYFRANDASTVVLTRLRLWAGE